MNIAFAVNRNSCSTLLLRRQKFMWIGIW